MDLNLRTDIQQEGVSDFLNPIFASLMVARDLPHQWALMYSAQSGEYDLGEALYTAGADADRYGIYEHGDALLLTRHYGSGRMYVLAAAKTQEAAKAAVAWVQSLLPKVEESDEPDSIPVRFWTAGMGGPTSVTRRISAPTLADIRGNYASEAIRDLDHITSDRFEPGKGGQLLLWYGPPGTGKTFALRALAQAWRKWCRIDYVVDPERFFGDSSYLMPVLLSHGQPQRHFDGDDEAPEWRLLIFEDTGELLSSDARARAGQGLSRLLNVVDGFIGQGLNTLILITTNEELDRLHPAVSRPGRCAVKTHFGPLPAEQAQRWAKERGLLVPQRAHSLAELFAVRDDTRHDDTDAAEQPKPAFGFHLPSERTA